MRKMQQKYLLVPRKSGSANQPTSTGRDEAIGRTRKHIKKIGVRVNESKHFFRQGCGTTLGVQPRAIPRKP